MCGDFHFFSNSNSAQGQCVSLASLNQRFELNQNKHEMLKGPFSHPRNPLPILSPVRTELEPLGGLA